MLMSLLAISGIFLKIPRLFLKICRWVMVRTALNCMVSGYSGTNSKARKPKVQFEGSDEGRKWGNKLFVLWVLSGIIGSIWVLCDLKDGGFSKRNERSENMWEEKALIFGEQFNVSKDQVQALATLLLKSDQGQNISRPPGNGGQKCQERLPMLLLKICWWVLIGLVVNCKVFRFCARSKQQNIQPLQQAQHHQLLHSQSSKSGGRWRKKLLILWVLIGVFGSMWIFWSMNNNIISRRKETLANMCDERARMLQDQFNVSMNHVHALAILVSAFHHGKHPSAIDQKTFAEYTERTAFERPLTSGVAYALKVLHSEREEFEKHHGWKIKKMETEDQSPVQDEYIPQKLDPSPVQDEYAPVIFSQETVSHIVSIDMMSGKEDRENILRARASGKGVLTSPFKLLKSNHLGVVLTFAVYNTYLPPNATPEERIEGTEGYLGASFDVPSLVEKLLHQLASKQTILVNVYDTTNVSAPINMYGPNVTNTGLWHLSNLEFGDPFRKHEMHCRFKQMPPLPWSAITTSIGVLVIVLLIGHIFHAAVNRIAKVEDDYRKMRELKVRAEAADVAKSQFLATVSHEIRTPMNGVLGMLQMLMDTDLDATQQDFARTAQASGKTLIALINEVLDQAKIESGRLELEAVHFDLRSILDNVLSLFYDKSQEKGIELAVYVSDRVPEILTGDPGRFRQIITNLVGNSIKFTEEGHIYVSVYLAEEAKSSSVVYDEVPKNHSQLVINGINPSYDTLSGFRVVDRQKSWDSFKMLDSVNSLDTTDTINLLVTVEDTGVGIPQEAQSRIFMPFMQADSSTSRTHGGTGIGLSISKCLVNLMGGEIGFVSQPGTGSTFAFTAVFTKGTTNSQDTKRQQSDQMFSDFRGMKALVVDGRSVRAEVTKYHLQRLGVHVEIAVSPKYAFSSMSSACESSATEHLDMVLVDKEAWGKGTELAFPKLLKELTQNGRPKPLKKLPKIFILATSISSAELDSFKSIGYVDNVIMKPLRLSMMSAFLQRALGMRNTRDQDRGQLSVLKSLLSGKQILVVDDNVVNRRVAAGALKKFGAIVTCADSGKVALTLLQPPHKFDACFMDVQMPEMDGFEATRQIRSIENKVNEQIKSEEALKEMYGNVRYWHIPVLAMTADVIQATHDQCARCGMDGYVSKPFEEDQLYTAVACFFESDNSELTR
ncbi:histidine kinase 3-like isoform X2 [Tasmannia lanceolata]|uniref:histidine kinase 3-like isoform X2 n=1 Tax=Tasmannia lanceolata TaxID=3420 RepID=UPI004064B075